MNLLKHISKYLDTKHLCLCYPYALSY